MGVRKERKWRQRTPREKRYSRTAHRQESRKAQKKRGIGKGRLDKPSKC